VVSLVGLTAGISLYWVDSIRRLASEVDDFLFVAAGTGPMAATIQSLARELPDSVRWLGAVPYEDALGLFAASDVTWYPGEDTGYFHNASPLKVFEGLGAGTQVVVAPRLRSLAALRLPSLHFAAPTAVGLAGVTAQVLASPATLTPRTTSAALAPYSWDVIAQRVGKFLREAMAAKQEGTMSCLADASFSS
jgi:glycosyltransferase involved in cell wall biosynthesis